MRPSQMGQIGFIDPQCRMIGLRLSDGTLTIVPMAADGQLEDAFELKFDELQTTDIRCLDGCAEPTIAVMYEDYNYKHVKTYKVDVAAKELKEGPWFQNDVDHNAQLLVPVPAPYGGVMVIGNNHITYCNGTANGSKPITIAIRTTTIYCHGVIDAQRYILGDHVGVLYVLHLTTHENMVTELTLEKMGVTSIPNTITYLDNGVAYVGGQFGDSQLIKLNKDANADGEFIEVLERFTNIGPVLDACVVDVDKQGQNQVVTCSGAYKDGSLRVIRNGIGIHEMAELDMPGIGGIWALRASDKDTRHTILAVSFVGQTAFLSVGGDELEGTSIPGALECASLYCGNVKGGKWIQVAENSIRLIDATTRELVSEWSHPSKKPISACACNWTQVVVACGSDLRYLRVGADGLAETGTMMMEHEVACLDISTVAGESEASVCIAGLWTDISLRVVDLTSMAEVSTESLGGDIIPRSVLQVELEGTRYVLCALGDGTLFSFVFDGGAGTLSEAKRVSLGTQPIVLSAFKHGESTHVFAASDRPTVIYSSNSKLVFSNVNLPEVTRMCSLNTETFPDCLTLVSRQGLKIGSINEIQKLQINSIPIGASPYRLTHQEGTASFLVLVHCDSPAADAAEAKDTTNYVRAYHQLTFEVVDTMHLEPEETPMSVISCTFADDPNEYFCVGTAFVDLKEDEPKRGRLLVLKLTGGKLTLVAETEVKGCVYTLAAFNGKLLAGINAKVTLFKWVKRDSGSQELSQECGHYGHIVVLQITVKGDFILVGDLMRSIALLAYKPLQGQIEEITHDFGAKWMTAQAMFDENTFVGAETGRNMFICKRSVEVGVEEPKNSLDTVCEFHLGGQVNVIKHGSLAMRTKDAATDVEKTLLYCTQEGSIGMVMLLTPAQFEFLDQVQLRLRDIVNGVGGFDHETWRSFKTECVRCFSQRSGGQLMLAYALLHPPGGPTRVRPLPLMGAGKPTQRGGNASTPQAGIFPWMVCRALQTGTRTRLHGAPSTGTWSSPSWSCRAPSRTRSWPV